MKLIAAQDHRHTLKPGEPEAFHFSENLHQPTANPLWRESYYFNLLGSDIVVETTIGLRPNQNVAERMALVFYHDETLVFIKPGRLTEFTPSALQAETGSYNCVTPLERWQIRIAGEFLVLPPIEEGTEITSFMFEVQNGRPAKQRPVVLDLAFQGVMPPYLYPAGALDFMGADTQHYEQVGQWTGAVRVGDDAVRQVSGLGVRDHSWGVRDWLRAEEWYWVNVLHPNEHLVLGYGRTEGENWAGSGFIHANGTPHPIRQIRVTAQHDEDTSTLVGEAQIEAEAEDGYSSGARIHRQRAVQFIPARGPDSLLRMSTNAGTAGDCAWLVQYGRRERIDAEEGG
jgi:hypothetical protein